MPAIDPEAESPSRTRPTLPTIEWAGYTWIVTTGSMVGGNTGSADNVFVDAQGRLHLRIVKRGDVWTCAELFTTQRMGFGTYQWHVEGQLDKLDANVVLGLFPYGPREGIGKDGQNEIDIEFSRWGKPLTPPGHWTVYPASGARTRTQAFDFSLDGTYTTSRFTWSDSAVEFSLFGGFQPPTSISNPIVAGWTYAPARPRQDIPQRALPLGMNLWLRGSSPSDGQSVEIIIHGFSRS